MKALDLCVKPGSVETLQAVLRLASSMGYEGVAVETTSLELSRGDAKRLSREYGVEVYRRITLRPSSHGEMLKMLAKSHGKYDLLVIESREPDVIRSAARDGRVGLVYISPLQARYMDRSQADLLRLGGGGVEARLADFLRALERRDYRRIRGLEALVRRGVAFGAKIVVGSCSTSLWGLRSPRSVLSILVVLGVPEPVAKTIVYSYPYSVIGR